jgi:hypothetical protein
MYRIEIRGERLEMYRTEMRVEGLALGIQNRQNRDKGRRTSSKYRTEIKGEGLALGTEQRLQITEQS